MGPLTKQPTKNNGEHMPDLTMIISALNERGVTYREMERRSAEAGYRVKFQTFSEYANHPPKSWPKTAATVRGMAAALGVTERAIVLAYAESLGVDVGRVEFADLVPLDADAMSIKMRDAVLSVIRAATEGVRDAASQESGPEAGGTADDPEAAIAEQAAAERARINAERGIDVTTPVPEDHHRHMSDGDDTNTGRNGAAGRGA